MNGLEPCADCGATVEALYPRTLDRQMVCFDCLPDAEVNKYPGWRERRKRQREQAERARRNFKGANHAKVPS